ncbi:MAG TPA: hypothetical protein VI756_27000 [Blastocatellia bacterium]
MSGRKLIPLFFALIFLFTVIAFADGDKVESAGAFSDSSASASVKGALEADGYKISLGDGTEVCRIWLSKGLATRAKTDTPGVLFNQIGDSALVGVISFPNKTTDYRGQVIKAGSYTLRYALQPADGNHLGIAPNRDFLLMSPLSLDQDAAAQFKFEDLVKMSAKSAGTNHPAGLSMISADAQKTFPAAIQDDSGHTVFEGKLKTASGEIAFGLIVKGVADQ